jgi:hypothetical protein
MNSQWASQYATQHIDEMRREALGGRRVRETRADVAPASSGTNERRDHSLIRMMSLRRFRVVR